MAESTRYFQGTSGLHGTLRELARRLDQLGVGYVVIGGMALAAHGYARMTEDIDLLVTRADLRKIHEHLVGRGYRRMFEGSKNIRDTETQVKIEFVLTGDYPGSGEPQPVSFPDPAETDPVTLEGVRFIGLERLVELKLASGMTGGADRAKDLVDVQHLVKTLRLKRDFAASLPYVRAKYEELWDGLHAKRTRYVRLWRSRFLTLEATSIDDMIGVLAGAADELRRMKSDGVALDPAGGTADDHAMLVTMDPAVAERYDMHDESEFFGDEDDTESDT